MSNSTSKTTDAAWARQQLHPGVQLAKPVPDARTCPKWQKCSAPICPLDHNIESRVHIKGDRVCFYLCEYVKPGGIAALTGRVATEHLEAVVRAYCDIVPRCAPLKFALARASKTASRLGKQPGGGGIKNSTHEATSNGSEE